jgi:hypothetical protein
MAVSKALLNGVYDSVQGLAERLDELTELGQWPEIALRDLKTQADALSDLIEGFYAKYNAEEEV